MVEVTSVTDGAIPTWVICVCQLPGLLLPKIVVLLVNSWIVQKVPASLGSTVVSL